MERHARLERPRWTPLALAGLLAMTLGLAAACAGSPATTSPDVAGPAQPGGPADPSEVGDFFDRVLGGQLEAEHLRGRSWR
jgi:hypothetical protein